MLFLLFLSDVISAIYNVLYFPYVVICNQGDIRLVNGNDERQGRVEVCNNNAWGTVCDDSFGTEEAQVACVQLGFSGDGEKSLNK